MASWVWMLHDHEKTSVKSTEVCFCCQILYTQIKRGIEKQHLALLISPSADLCYLIHNHPKAQYNYARHFLDCVWLSAKQAQREQHKDLFCFTTEFHIITVVLVHLKNQISSHVLWQVFLFFILEEKPTEESPDVPLNPTPLQNLLSFENQFHNCPHYLNLHLLSTPFLILPSLVYPHTHHLCHPNSPKRGPRERPPPISLHL